MTNDERNDLLELKGIITGYLAEIERQIIQYDPRADDEAFDFLILKARRYQQTLAEIERRLTNEY